MNASPSVLLEAVNVQKEYHTADTTVRIFFGLSLQLYAGERLAIVGKSGSGKTTLLNVVSGLEGYTSGDVLFKGTSLARMSLAEQAQFRNRSIGFVYQFHHLLPECTALENVLLPFLIRGEANTSTRNQAYSLLERVGLAHRVDALPNTLSGGERQRVAVARALVGQPECVFLDEPTGNLDATSAEQVWQLLEDVCAEHGTACILVTHDTDFAHRADRCLLLANTTLSTLSNHCVPV